MTTRKIKIDNIMMTVVSDDGDASVGGANPTTDLLVVVVMASLVAVRCVTACSFRW